MSDHPEMMVAAAFAVAASGIDDTWETFPNRSQHLVAQDSAGLTALHHAANFGLLDAVTRLVEGGSTVDALDGTGRSPLILASISGSLPTVKFLLEKGADLNLRDGTYKQTPLMFAVEYGRGDVVQHLCTLDGVDVNAVATGWNEYTALIFAAVWGHSEIMENLLNHGTDLEKVDSESGRSALAWVTRDGNIDAAKLLIRAGANLYSSDYNGQTPVLHAAMSSAEMLKACIEEPRASGIPDTEPLPRARAIESGLRYACEADNKDILDFILGSGKYLNAQDEHQRHAFFLVSEHGNKTAMENSCKEGLGINMRDNDGRTPLSWAAAKGSKECVGLLLKEGADPDHVDNTHRTPLSWAAGEGHLSVVKQLLAYRLDKQKQGPFETKDDKKGTRKPVPGKESRTTQQAATRSAAKTSKAKAKAIEVDSLDNKSWTPLVHAAYNGHKNVVEILLSHGANPSITFMGYSGNSTIAQLLDHRKQSLERDVAIDSTSPVNDSKPEPEALDAVLQILNSSESLWTTPLKEAVTVDSQFSATVVKIPQDEESNIAFETLKVDAVLREGLSTHFSGDDSYRWLHLPANNVSLS